MRTLMSAVREFMVAEDGPTAVEYAIMLALIICVCIGIVTTLGQSAKAKFTEADAALQ